MDDLVLRFLLIFLLIAGASANGTPVGGGTLTFDVIDPPSVAWWIYGSAFIYIMLIAGADAWSYPTAGGALMFDVANSPSGVYFGVGSALSCEYPA